MSRSCFVGLSLAALVVTGCGEAPDPTGTVSGTVTLNGQPFDGEVMVMLLDTSTGQGSSGEVGPGGAYTLPDPLPLGTYKVYITPTPPPEPTDGSPPPPLKMDPRIPDKYLNEISSDISANVLEGENTVPVDLKK